jgi:hypothetical protein
LFSSGSSGRQIVGGLAGKMSRKRCGKRIFRLGRPEGLGGGDGDLKRGS